MTESGKARLRQVIFWQYVSDERSTGKEVVAWRMLYDSNRPLQENGRWVCRWREKGCIREVFSRCVLHTFTSHDPEIDDREITPEDQRRKLTPIP